MSQPLSNEVCRKARLGKQVNYTQDSSFFSKKRRRAALGGIWTHDTLKSRRALYQLNMVNPRRACAARGYVWSAEWDKIYSPDTSSVIAPRVGNTSATISSIDTCHNDACSNSERVWPVWSMCTNLLSSCNVFCRHAINFYCCSPFSYGTTLYFSSHFLFFILHLYWCVWQMEIPALNLNP